MSMNPTRHPRPRSNKNPLARARALIDSVASKQDWLNAWSTLFQIIQESDDPRAKTMAMRLICEYRFGKPYRIEGDSEGDVPLSFYKS